jgi:phosphate transport system permease protein
MISSTEPTAVELKATGRNRRRLVANKVAEGIAAAAAAAGVAILAIVVWSVLQRGASALDWDFFVKTPAVFGQTGGGIAPAFAGSIVLVAFATLMALPFGVLAAIYVSEFAAERVGAQIRLWLDVLNGFPSIVIGIFAYSLLVKEALPLVGWGHHLSALAGSFGLAVIMLPLVSRATMEVLTLVPGHQREASYALGVSKWQTVLRVVLPAALGGIVTGTTLAVARAAGETAPLLFTSYAPGTVVDWNPTHAVASIPLTIFASSEAPDPQSHAQAWAAAFVLIVFVLVSSLTARFLYDRSRRKLGPAS